MPDESVQVFPRAGIPQPDCFVITPAGNRQSIGRKRYRTNRTCMIRKGMQAFSGAGIPQPDCFVITPADNRQSIGRKGDGTNRRRMPGKQIDFSPGIHIIHPNADASRNRQPRPIR